MSLNTKFSEVQESKKKEISVQPSKSNPLCDLILAKNLSDAFPLINSNPELLAQTSSRGRLPMHVAAMRKETDLFKAMLEKGANPFLSDADGYSAYYHALIQKCPDIVALCLSFFPTPNWLTTEDGGFDETLVKAGFHPYVISSFKAAEFPETDDDSHQKENDTNELYSFLQQLLFDGNLPAYTAKVKKTKRKDKKIEDNVLIIDPLFLQKIAHGFVDAKVEPAQIVELLTHLYSSLKNPQKLACVYLLKEFIKADVAHEWIEAPAFQIAMKQFIKGMNNGNVLALAAVKTEFTKLYTSLLPQEHLSSAENLAFDLAKLFYDPFIRLTPQNFTGRMLAKKNVEKNPAYAEISAFSNNIANLVSMDILKAKANDRKRNLLKFYLEVIAICLKKGKYQDDARFVYNYAAACAILNGIETTQVSRLKKVWEPLLKEVAVQQPLEEYKALFSPEKAFASLRREMTIHPQCIPFLAIYCAEKDKNSEASVQYALELNGSANMRFAQHMNFLRQFQGFQGQRFRTNVPTTLANLYFTSDYCWALSYQIEPPKIIKLDTNPDLATLAAVMDTLKIQNAPLVVKLKNKKYFANDAFAKLTAYLDAKFPKTVSFVKMEEEQPQLRQIVLDKAAEIVMAFESIINGPQNKLIDTTTEALSALSLDATVSRKRSKTISILEMPEQEEEDRHRSNTLIEISPEGDKKEKSKHKRSHTSVAYLGTKKTFGSIEIRKDEGHQEEALLAKFRKFTPSADTKAKSGKSSYRHSEDVRKRVKNPRPSSSTTLSPTDE